MNHKTNKSMNHKTNKRLSPSCNNQCSNIMSTNYWHNIIMNKIIKMNNNYIKTNKETIRMSNKLVAKNSRGVNSIRPTMRCLTADIA